MCQACPTDLWDLQRTLSLARDSVRFYIMYKLYFYLLVIFLRVWYPYQMDETRSCPQRSKDDVSTMIIEINKEELIDWNKSSLCLSDVFVNICRGPI